VYRGAKITATIDSLDEKTGSSDVPSVAIRVRLCVRFLIDLTAKILCFCGSWAHFEQHVASGVILRLARLYRDDGSRGRSGNGPFRKGLMRPASGFYGRWMTVTTSVTVSVR